MVGTSASTLSSFRAALSIAFIGYCNSLRVCIDTCVSLSGSEVGDHSRTPCTTARMSNCRYRLPPCIGMRKQGSLMHRIVVIRSRVRMRWGCTP